ncbi:glycosyltransferase [Ornithinimicrobium kibberense]|uniref:Glycosyltransferase n=1 Tax=Ornithinimicrobium kibberense TaxID=282060 RepID=A0ABV5V5V8_9MICO|nr:glycosyltransferase [Ornithinimicrobium kibberense]
MLADAQYAGRFRQPHHVVPNTTTVPVDPPPAGSRPDHPHRVVYLGSVTLERGVQEMIEVARRLTHRTSGQVRLEVLGPAHGRATTLLSRAQDEGLLTWSGFVPNEEALTRLDGALAGLSLLHDVANFRPSMPTKVVEYMAHGVPAITTPLPVPANLVRRSGGGSIVPFGDVESVVDQIISWHDHPEEAARVGRAGHAMVAAHYDWRAQAPLFVDLLTRIAEEEPRS